MGLIYKATSPSKKVYIGKTKYSLEYRVKDHKFRKQKGKLECIG